MKKIAITGTIGSGKSTCSQIIREFGYEVFDCDLEVHKLYQCDDKVIQLIRECIPSSWMNNQISREIIASVIFKDSAIKKKIEDIIYPALIGKLKIAMDKNKDDLFFAEVPLLFESGWDVYFDEVIVVVTSNDVAIERLMNKRKMIKDDIIKRLSMQKDVSYKIERADKIIYNDSTVENMKYQIEKMLKEELQ